MSSTPPLSEVDFVSREPAVAALVPCAEAATEFMAQSRSARTRNAYKAQWEAFARWCAEHGLEPLPARPESLSMYIASMASSGRTVATISQALSAISEGHRLAGRESPRAHPVVRETWKGVRRAMGTAPSRRVAPILVDDLRLMVTCLPDRLIGVRDRALLVVGFAGALRRAELVAIDVEHLEFVEDGLVVRIARSKTDQEQRGADVGLPFGSDPRTCPVRTMRAWLDAAGLSAGAVFRSVSRHDVVRRRLWGRDVARVVKRAATAAGLNAQVVSGHSLRAGLATSAARAGKPDRAIMRQGRWASRGTLDRYIRGARLLDGDNAASGIGL